MKNTIATKSNEQFTFTKGFLLHVFPGILTTAALLAIKPLTDKLGYPPLLAFLLAVLLVDIPFMLVVMLRKGKKLTGHLSLEGVVQYREKVSWKVFTLVFVGAFVLLYLVIMLTTPLNAMLSGSVFSWLPDWIFFEEASQYAGYPKELLVAVFTLHLVITGIILPWVEELYFRGFLLPRFSRFQVWAPLIGGMLFGLYHGWQLFGWVGVSLLGIGLGYVVWWKKDIRLGISLHVFANAFVRLVLLMSILAM